MNLAEPFEYTDYVRPACLPQPNFTYDNGRMIISGTGNTAKGGVDSRFVNPMQYTTIPMCSQKACDQNRIQGHLFQPGFLKLYHNWKQIKISGMMLCGGEEGKDSCQGDSGGPLVAEVDGKFTLVSGVRSFCWFFNLKCEIWTEKLF